MSGTNHGGDAGQDCQACDEQNGSGRQSTAHQDPRQRVTGASPSAEPYRLASPAVRRTPPRPAALAEVAIIGLFVATEALLARRLLHADTFFDEGTYLVSVDALRHGQALGEQIFTAQPPGWYYLLDLVASVSGNSLEAIRGGLALFVGLGAAAAYLAGRAFAGRTGGAVTAGLFLIAFPLPLYATRVLSDPSSLVLALAAVALAATARRNPEGLLLAAASGAAFGLGSLVKLYAVLALPTIALLLASGTGRARRRLLAAALGFALPILLTVLANVRALPELWDAVVTYHRDASGIEILDNVDAVTGVFNARMPFGWLVALAMALALAAAARRRSVQTAALWLWPVLVCALLLWHDPLLEHHIAAMAVSLVPAAGVTLGSAIRDLPPRWMLVAGAALALVFVAGYAQQVRRLDSEVRPEEPGIVWAGGELARSTTPDELVVSDLPLSAYLADRRVPGELVDTAMLRFATGSLTPDRVFQILDERCVRAVAAGRVFTVLPGFMKRLAEKFPTSKRRFGVVVFTRERCS